MCFGKCGARETVWCLSLSFGIYQKMRLILARWVWAACVDQDRVV
jgi:hypothetical protein